MGAEPARSLSSITEAGVSGPGRSLVRSWRQVVDQPIELVLKPIEPFVDLIEPCIDLLEALST